MSSDGMHGQEPGEGTHNELALELMVSRCLTEWSRNPRWRHLDMERHICEVFGCTHFAAVNVIRLARLALRDSAGAPELADKLVAAYWNEYDNAGKLMTGALIAGKLTTARQCIETRVDILTKLARHLGLDAPTRIEVTPVAPGAAKVERARYAKLDVAQLEALATLDVEVTEAQDSTATPEGSHG